MSRIALGVDYDGSAFSGWQRQENAPSVQAVLEAALSQVAHQSISTICAGRTDRGVHASGQVVHFDSPVLRPMHAWILGTNALLPPSVRVQWATEVPLHFNARRSALRRRYRYCIYNHPIRPSYLRDQITWHYRSLCLSSMKAASRHWIGEHDFSSFRAKECQSHSPIRFMQSIRFYQINRIMIVEFMANAFLHHMVRNMMGTLLKIGEGLARPEWALEVLQQKDRKQAGVTAPPTGLYLVEVQYPELFSIPKQTLGPWFLNLNEENELI